MGLQVFSDNATTTLASPITASATALAVASSATFPTLNAGDWFVATLLQLVSGLVTAYEIVKVTAVVGTNWTIARAQEGTAAQPWVSGNTVSLLPTSGGLAQFLQRGNLFLLTPAETAAAITPSNYGYPEGDIRRYGAITGAFDNSTAINSALLVSSKGGAAAYIPGGIWQTSNPLIAYPGSSMYGAGKASVISAANGVDGLQFTASDSGIVNEPRFFRDFAITGTLLSTANNAHGIYINAGVITHTLFSNLAISNFLYGAYVQGLYYSTFFNCFVQNCWNGFYFNNQSVNVSLLDCDAQLTSATGTVITGAGYSMGVSVQGAPEVEGFHIQGGSIYGYNYDIHLGLIFECQIEAVDVSFATICPIYFTSVLGPLVVRDCWIELASSASGVWNGGNASQVPGNLTGIFITAVTPSVNSKVQIVGNYITADSALTGSTGLYIGNSNAGIVVQANQIFNFDVGIGGGNTLANTGGAIAGALINANTINANTSAILLHSLTSNTKLGPNYIVAGTPLTLTAGWPTSLLYEDASTPMSGTASLSGGTSVAVAFANSLPAASYQISLSPSAQSNPWWTAKTVSGFTINFSAGFTGSVDWTVTL